MCANPDQCDEQSPTCQNCLKHRVHCSYSDAPPPRLSRKVSIKVWTDWYPNVDAGLFNYFVTEVGKTMIPLSRWTRASQMVVANAISVSLSAGPELSRR
jgi:hypothetical protein